MSVFAKKADFAFKASMCGFVLHVFLIIASTLIWVPKHQSPTLIVTILLLLPLLLLLPWLIKRNIRAHIWLCFIMLGYFMPAVENCFMFEQYGWLPFIEALNCVYLFIVAMMFARWEQKRYEISVTR